MAATRKAHVWSVKWAYLPQERRGLAATHTPRIDHRLHALLDARLWRACERRRWAACLVAAAIFGRKQRRVSVLLLLALHSTREARRARRGAVAPCGCATVHVKACVLATTVR